MRLLYPDDTSPIESGQARDEELSETERHWNQLAVGITTVATAVIAAVLLTAGLDSGNQGKWDGWDISGALLDSFATFLYLAILFSMSRVLFPLGTTRDSRVENRRGRTFNLLLVFGALAITAATVIGTSIIPPTIEWYQTG